MQRSSDVVLDITFPAGIDELILPSLYLLRNDSILLNRDTNVQGVYLSILSTEQRVFVLLQTHSSPFAKYQSQKDPAVVLFEIERKYLGSFKSSQDVVFSCVKPKKSFSMMANLSGAPVGSLLMSTLFTGLGKLGAKLEDDHEDKRLAQFELSFSRESKDCILNIACEQYYRTEFEQFLKNNWAEIPIIVDDVVDKKEGCFIATACYGDYDHPDVLTLRRFRDEVLMNSRIGRLVVTKYYKWSPAIAERITSTSTPALTIRLLIIKPLSKILRIL